VSTPTEIADALEYTVEQATDLLRSHAFTERDDDGNEVRRLIHTRAGGIGCDWDLSDAIAFAERSTWRGYAHSILGHNLGIEADERFVCFDVPIEVAS
jgi:hypothetical protein